jgi:NTE family protein
MPPAEIGARSAPHLGLALGGGAVLGFSHLGILQALHQDGIRVDRIAGTSAGALIAALHAFGVGPERMHDLLVPITWRKVSNFSASSLGLLSNESIADILRGELGAVRIEDADIPLAIVTADIHTGETVTLREGPLADAVRASAAIPGIYSPISIGGRMLVDGGIVANVPVRPLRDMDADVIVAATLGEALSFQPVRTLVGVLTNAFLIAVYTATRLDLMEGVDVVITPDLEVYNHWDVRQRDELIAKGYEAGEAAVPRIRDALDQAGGPLLTGGG